jgi:hypothetical protein
MNEREPYEERATSLVLPWNNGAARSDHPVFSSPYTEDPYDPDPYYSS